MTVCVLLFAGLRRAAGFHEMALELPADATVRTAAESFQQQTGLDLTGVMSAVNERFAEPSTPLAEGDVLALLPPVSGG